MSLSNVMKLTQIGRKIVAFRKLPENYIFPGIDNVDRLQTHRNRSWECLGSVRS